MRIQAKTRRNNKNYLPYLLKTFIIQERGHYTRHSAYEVLRTSVIASSIDDEMTYEYVVLRFSYEKWSQHKTHHII